MNEIELHVECNEHVDKLINLLRNGYWIKEGPITITHNGVLIIGEYKGFKFGAYFLEKQVKV